jgi:tetratricopeptide (TPR) repeat protein
MKDSRQMRRNIWLWMLIVAFAAAPSYAFPSPHVSDAVKQWQLIQAQGMDAFEANQYGKAERLLKEATIEARAFPPGDMKFSQSSGELGRLLTVRGRFTEAEPYLEEELHLKRWAVADEKVSGKLIPDMGALVRFYLVYGTAKKADPLTMDILFFVEGKLREETEEREEAAKKEKGGPLIGWAGQAVPVMRDPLLEWAITCDDIGNLYAERGRVDLSDRLFKAALDVKATILGKQHLSLANSYDSLGKICMQKKQYSEAESYFKQSLDITEKIQPPDHPQVFSRVDRLGKCLITEDKLSEAEELYQVYVKSLHIHGIVSGIEPRALYVLGCVYCDEKKFANAAPVLDQALHLSEQFNGTCSVQITPYLREYAYALYYSGRRGEADHLRARADSIAPIVRAIAPSAKMEAGTWSQPSKESAKKSSKDIENGTAEITAANEPVKQVTTKTTTRTHKQTAKRAAKRRSKRSSH